MNEPKRKTYMKKTRLILMLAAIMAAMAPLSGQTKSELNTARKEAAAAAKALKREGFKAIELGDIQTRLERFFLKVNAGGTQIIGIAENCMSTNLAQITALTNAANQYAMLAGGEIRGRIVSNAQNLSGLEVDNLVSSFERLVAKDIRGELVPYITAVRDKWGRITARAYCLVDQDAAYQVRRRALEIALEEQSLSARYGSMVSAWIDEGFDKEQK